MKKSYTPTALFIFAMTLSVGFINHTAAQQNLHNHSVVIEKVSNSPKECAPCQPGGISTVPTSPTGGGLATAPDLSTAANFVVLGSSTVTNTGPSILRGNLGVSPGTSITGFPPGFVIGTTAPGDPVAAQAQADALAAYNNLVGQTCDTDLTGQDLGGLTLTPGVYCFDTSAQLTGTLTLDGQGDPDAVFVFQIGSTFITADLSSIVRVNGVTACNVFFQVGVSATVDTATAFQGNIIAFASITINTGASLIGRAIALNGGVTLDSNRLTICNLSPTAASVTVSGRVMDADKRGMRAEVTLTSALGEVFQTFSNPLGFFRLSDIPGGHSYVAQARFKPYKFTSKFITIQDDLTDLDFMALDDTKR